MLIQISLLSNIVVPDSTKTVPIKEEPEPRQDDGGGISCTEIDIDLLNIKKECLDHSERMTQTAGNVDLYLF